MAPPLPPKGWAVTLSSGAGVVGDLKVDAAAIAARNKLATASVADRLARLDVDMKYLAGQWAGRVDEGACDGAGCGECGRPRVPSDELDPLEMLKQAASRTSNRGVERGPCAFDCIPITRTERAVHAVD